jgi:predicted acetyltransferase
LDAQTLAIVPARPEQRGLLENLFQLYVHDFSEFWAGREDGELDETGRFGPYGPLDSYWRDADRIALILRWQGRPAGFALINRFTHLPGAVDRAMAEFFVVRKHRRTGLGARAARTLFSRYPGLWEVAVARRNTGAAAFWRAAISGHPDSREIETHDLETAAWNGPVFRFRIGERAG